MGATKTAVKLIDTKEYFPGLAAIVKDARAYVAVSGRKTSVEIPHKLALRALELGALEDLKRGVVGQLESFCAVSDWIQYEDEDGEAHIKFSITPERVRDEV